MKTIRTDGHLNKLSPKMRAIGCYDKQLKCEIAHSGALKVLIVFD